MRHVQEENPLSVTLMQRMMHVPMVTMSFFQDSSTATIRRNPPAFQVPIFQVHSGYIGCRLQPQVRRSNRSPSLTPAIDTSTSPSAEQLTRHDSCQSYADINLTPTGVLPSDF